MKRLLLLLGFALILHSELNRNVFHFLPLRLTAGDLERIHGTNERIAVQDYDRAIRFYQPGPNFVLVSDWRYLT